MGFTCSSSLSHVAPLDLSGTKGEELLGSPSCRTRDPTGGKAAKLWESGARRKLLKPLWRAHTWQLDLCSSRMGFIPAVGMIRIRERRWCSSHGFFEEEGSTSTPHAEFQGKQAPFSQAVGSGS